MTGGVVERPGGETLLEKKLRFPATVVSFSTSPSLRGFHSSNFACPASIRAKVDYSWDATEAMPPIFADAIVECTETRSSLRANRLVVLAELLESSIRFFTSRKIRHDRTRSGSGPKSSLLPCSCEAA